MQNRWTMFGIDRERWGEDIKTKRWHILAVVFGTSLFTMGFWELLGWILLRFYPDNVDTAPHLSFAIFATVLGLVVLFIYGRSYDKLNPKAKKGKGK